MPYAEGFVESQGATPQAETTEEKILQFCITPKSRSEIQEYIGLSEREYFRKTFLKPLLDSGKLLRTIPDKPTSPNQKFYTAPQREG